jgi:hypothetical protein
MPKGKGLMEWQKVSRERFQSILDEEVAALPQEAAKILKVRAVPIFEQPCLRSEDYGIEKVFAVARAENRVLFFDDVEDEFGVGIPDNDGVLRDLGTFGSFIAAVLAL